MEPAPALAPPPVSVCHPPPSAWSERFDPRAWDEAVSAIYEPAGLYVHVPFCRSQCLFCGAHMVVARHPGAGDVYLDALARQIRALPLSGPTLPVSRVHVGGGTPTWLSIRQLERLFSLLDRRFPRVTGAEVVVEVDPDVTTDAQVDALAALGATSIVIGVQSCDPAVLVRVNRPQDPDRVDAVVRRARTHGIEHVHVDLMYGLPRQDEASLAATVARVSALAPDRIALYAYAHVPWMKPHQRNLDAAALPPDADRLAMWRSARQRLQDAGYTPIGIDSFARADDPLSIARRAGTLRRGVLGYATQPIEVIGLGTSAVTATEELYAQQETQLTRWYRRIAEGRSPIVRGCVLTPDDKLVREVVEHVLCRGSVDYGDIARRFGVDFRARFARELASLADLADAGTVVPGSARLAVADDAAVVARVARAFAGDA